MADDRDFLGQLPRNRRHGMVVGHDADRRVDASGLVRLGVDELRLSHPTQHGQLDRRTENRPIRTPGIDALGGKPNHHGTVDHTQRQH